MRQRIESHAFVVRQNQRHLRPSKRAAIGAVARAIAYRKSPCSF
jgi:hypothetical protein